MTDLIDTLDTTAKKLTSHDLKNGLRISKGDGNQVFFEVGNDTGAKVTRHADAVSIGLWPSTGHQIHGYEIKVSRGDFLSEMKQPEKAWPVMQFCHRWSLLTPPGLVKVDELPPTWGLQTFDGKMLRTVKQAPLLTPVPPTPGFMAALVRRAGEADESLIKAAVERAQTVWYEGEQRRVDSAIKSEQARIGHRAAERDKQLAAFTELFTGMSSYEIEQLAPALAMLRRAGVGKTYGGLEQICKDMEKATASIRSIFEGDEIVKAATHA